MASVSYDKEYWVNELVWLSKDALLMCGGRQKADVQEKGILQVIKVLANRAHVRSPAACLRALLSAAVTNSMEHAAAVLGIDWDKVWQVNWAQGSAELKSVGTVVAHTANCTNIAIDATAKHFATGAYDGTVCIWLCTALHMQVCRGAEAAAASPRNRVRHAIGQGSRPCAPLYVGLPEWPDRDAGEVACLRPACTSLEEVSLRAMRKPACRPVPCFVP